MPDCEYEAILARADDGDTLTVEEVVTAIEDMHDNGIKQYRGMTPEIWLDDVLTLVRALPQ